MHNTCMAKLELFGKREKKLIEERLSSLSSVGNHSRLFYSFPGRYDLREFFRNLENKRPHVLHVGLGMESPEGICLGPISLFEVAASTKGKVHGIDIMKEPVEEAKRILKSGRIVISKRLMGEMAAKGMERSPLKQFAKEDRDFIVISLPKELRDRVSVEQADMALSTPLEKPDVLVATWVGQYVDPLPIFVASLSNSLKKGGHAVIDEPIRRRIEREGIFPYSLEDAGFKLIRKSESTDPRVYAGDFSVLQKVEDKDFAEVASGVPHVSRWERTSPSPPDWRLKYSELLQQMGTSRGDISRISPQPVPGYGADDSEIQAFQKELGSLGESLGDVRGVADAISRMRGVVGKLHSYSRTEWEKRKGDIAISMRQLKHFAALREEKEALEQRAQAALASAPAGLRERLQLAMESRDYKLMKGYLEQAGLPAS